MIITLSNSRFHRLTLTAIDPILFPHIYRFCYHYRVLYLSYLFYHSFRLMKNFMRQFI